MRDSREDKEKCDKSNKTQVYINNKENLTKLVSGKNNSKIN